MKMLQNLKTLFILLVLSFIKIFLSIWNAHVMSSFIKESNKFEDVLKDFYEINNADLPQDNLKD
jgi:hypothetical protein